LAGLASIALLVCPSEARAYSVCAHEAVVDAVWDDQLAPLLRLRFPHADDGALAAARAYAYGGSLIQDLGYYPFGSKLFSNLVHYVRAGDFVEALMRDAQDVDELAFGLGALAHYTSDTLGHPLAVNRAVPLVYPKMRAQFGDEVLYVQSPARHVMVEFAFDVVEVARGAFKSDVYQRRIGFEVSMPVLERAFRETYGFPLEDLFGDADLAIGTYRYAVSRLIPDMTRLAWREKRDEILAATPNVTERDVVYTMTRQQYEQKFGVKYRKPGLLARFIVLLFKVVPKFGPFKPLAFEPLTPDADRLFRDSFASSTNRYRAYLREVRANQLSLASLDLDTGMPPRRGANTLADETYADLLKHLAERKFAGVPPALRRDINAHFTSRALPRNVDGKARKLEREAAPRLAALNASSGRP
jgi:zinc dependent phospholipase C